MAAEGTVLLADVLATLRRRRALVLAIAALVTVIAAGVAVQMPDIYTASTVVYFDPGKLPRGFERAGLTAPRLNELLAMLSQEVLSRESMRALIDELQLYEVPPPPPDLAASAAEAQDEESKLAAAELAAAEDYAKRVLYAGLVERARKDVKIEVIKIYAHDFLQVTVDARTAELAARAVNRIAELLDAKNRAIKLRRARELSEFAAREVDRARRAFDDAQAELFRFREQNRETLPEREEALLGQLGTLRTRTLARRREIDEANASRAAVEYRVNGLFLSQRRPDGTTTPGYMVTAVSPERRALEAELWRAESELASAKGRYKNPDLWMPMQTRVDNLKDRIATIASDPAPVLPAAAPGGDRAGTVPAGAPQGQGGVAAEPLGGNADKIVAELVRRQAAPETIREVQDLVAEISMLSRRIDGLAREQEVDLKEIDRLELLRASFAPTQRQMETFLSRVAEAERIYRDMQREQLDASKFLAAESSLQGGHLRSMELAEPPVLPGKPNRILIVFGALFAGLGLGGGISYLLEIKNGGYHDKDHLEEDLGLPVLAVIPAVPNPEQVAAGDVFVLVADEQEGN
jgi:uncharacterized protein involved in exopolysaccharide biosynthesis